MTVSEVISKLFTSSGPGGVVVMAVISVAAVIYFQLTRWILDGGKDEDQNYFR